MTTSSRLPPQADIDVVERGQHRVPPAEAQTTQPDAMEGETEIVEPLTLPDLRLLRRFWQGDVVSTELLRFADMVVGLIVASVAVLGGNLDFMPHEPADLLLERLTPRNLLLLGGFIALWPVTFNLFGLYNPRHVHDRRAETRRLLGACTVVSASLVPLLVVAASGAFDMRIIVLAWALAAGGTFASRQLLRLPLASKGARTRRRVLIVGSGPRAYKLYRDLTDDRRSGTEVVGFVDAERQILHPEIRARMLGTLDDLERILMHTVVDEVLIALPVKSCYEGVQSAIRVCEQEGIESKYLADVFQSSLPQRPLYEEAISAPVLTHKVAAEDGRLLIKRAVDVAGAAAGLIVLAPLFLAVALAIKVNSPGPVLFGQKRFGYNKRLFRMFKFRTMVRNAETLMGEVEHLNEVSGPIFKIRKDPRITAVGRFLRNTSIDELPQLINVLRGEMSLVGPRPMSTRDVHRFDGSWLMRRFSVRPGITGLWQVSGRSELTFDEWIALDLQYIDQWSLWLDLKILLKTVPAVFRGSGAM
jgi:exopolysaccharide biosynthesis polyprenyl glycosylphosphotransferase